MCIPNSLAYQTVLCIKRLYHKYSLSHFLLLFSYLVFVLSCGLCFYAVESRTSKVARANILQKHLAFRDRFISNSLLPEIFNNTRLLVYIHQSKSDYLKSIVTKKFDEYENLAKLRNVQQKQQDLTVLTSVVFAFSCVTTIGYSHVYPVTPNGRTLSVLISVIGVPFTLVVIHDLSYLLTKLFDLPCVLFEKIWATFRFCTLRISPESELTRSWQSKGNERNDFRLTNSIRLLAIPATLAVLAVLGWVTIGCFLATHMFPAQPLSAVFYFVVNTLLTIGHAENEIPEDRALIVLGWLSFSFIGLSLISMFINLLHSKFSAAYWLPGRMYVPLERCKKCQHLASSESIDEFTVSDSPLNHLTTIGVLQTEDKCPLISFQRSDMALIDAVAQTDETNDNQLRAADEEIVVRLASGGSAVSRVTSRHPMQSTFQDDVHSLFSDSLNARPARII